MQEDIVAPLRDELIDISFRQEEILTELAKLVNATDKDEKVLLALESCFKSLEVLEENYKNAFLEFERAAYSKAVDHFKL